MALPKAQFVMTATPDHLGFPEWDTFHTQIHSKKSYNGAYPSSAHPWIQSFKQALVDGINMQRVSITYVANAATATLTWLTGTHDFKVGEWVNLQAHGGVVSTNVENYYEVTAVTGDTSLTIAIPEADRATFTPTPEDSSFFTDDLLHSFVTAGLTSNTSVLGNISRAWTTGWTNSSTFATLGTTNPKFGSSYTVFPINGLVHSPNNPGTINWQNTFCHEFWARFPVVTDSRIINVLRTCGENSPAIKIQNNKIVVAIAGAIVITANTDIVANQWTHIALSRRKGNVRLFINGVLQDTQAADPVPTWIDGHVRIGPNTTGAAYEFHMQNYVYTQGHHRYSSTFTPRTTQTNSVPGKGYFVTRGGDICIAAINGTNPEGFHTNGGVENAYYLMQLKSANVNSDMFATINLGVQVMVRESVSAIGYAAYVQNVSAIGGSNTSLMHRATQINSTSADAEVKQHVAFIFSRTGFYTYTYSDSAVAKTEFSKAQLQFYGLGIDKLKNVMPPIDDLISLKRSLVATAVVTGNTTTDGSYYFNEVTHRQYKQRANTSQYGNADHFNTKEMSLFSALTHDGVSASTPNSVAGMSTTNPTTWMLGRNPTSPLMAALSATQVLDNIVRGQHAPEANLLIRGIVWDKIEVRFGAQAVVEFPGLFIGVLGDRNGSVNGHYRQSPIRKVKYGKYGSLARQGFLLCDNNAVGLISNNPADWDGE